MSLKIKLQDDNNGCCTTGQYIIGEVEANFRKVRRIKGIKITLKGRGHVWFYQSSTANRKSTIYTGKETYIIKEEMLHEEGHMGPGLLKFPFRFYLPSYLPPTFQIKNGGIKYYLKAEILSTLRSYKLDINVFSPINLNNYSIIYQAPRQAFKELNLNSCWCKNYGHVSLEVRLEKYAFIVGESINVRVIVENLSTINILYIKMELLQEITYTCTEPKEKSRETNILIKTQKYPGVSAKTTHNGILQFLVPDDASFPNFESCNLFTVRHTFHVSCVFASLDSNLCISMKPIIGHISRQLEEEIPPPYSPVDNNVLVEDRLPVPPLHSYDNPALDIVDERLPTYEDVILESNLENSQISELSH